jgi:hypothetical protein
MSGGLIPDDVGHATQCAHPEARREPSGRL